MTGRYLLMLCALAVAGQAEGPGSAAGSRRIIDMHVHTIPAAWSPDATPVNPVTGLPSSATKGVDLLPQTLAQMEQHGIQLAVVSGPLDSVYEWVSDADPARGHGQVIVGYYARLQVQASRTANRVTGYANMMYGHAPSPRMAIDQLASDDKILAAVRLLDAESVLAGFHEAGLSPYVNAELSFAYFMQREVEDNRNAAERFRAALLTYLETGEAATTEWGHVG